MKKISTLFQILFCSIYLTSCTNSEVAEIDNYCRTIDNQVLTKSEFSEIDQIDSEGPEIKINMAYFHNSSEIKKIKASLEFSTDSILNQSIYFKDDKLVYWQTAITNVTSDTIDKSEYYFSNLKCIMSIEGKKTVEPKTILTAADFHLTSATQMIN